MIVDIATVARKLAALMALKYFPREPEAQVAIVSIVCRMASKLDQIDWLVESALAVYDDWPGPRELRALFCSRWRPADGIQAYSQLYPADENGGGFPSHIYPASNLPALPTPGSFKEIPMVAESQAIIDEALEAMPKMPKARPIGDAFEARLRKVLQAPADRPAQPLPTPQIITAEDILLAVEDLHRRRSHFISMEDFFS